MIDTEHIDRIEGSTAYDAAGEKVGRVGQLYLDDQTGAPSWVTVATGLFGTAETFVPLEGASFDGQDLRLAYSKDTVKNAPRLDTDEHLDQAEEAELFRYYGLGGTTGTVTETTETTRTTGTYAGTTGMSGTTGTHVGARDDEDAALLADRAGDDAEASVVLSEERLDIGKVEQESRVRLRKYVTTETETITVPVRKETLVIERVPASDSATEPITGPDGSTEILEEITLREERVVVGKETVAVEQVRVGKQEVTEDREVSAEVRKERADVDVDGTDGTLGGGDTGRTTL
jgi:uncharacterized protein (TIGR02271 family)